MYNILYKKLLVLQKILTKLLNKQFIQVSNLLVVAPVLFVQKPSGGLWFYVNYCNLNKVLYKDQYLLLLIQETLCNISKAKWFIKLDIIVIFYKIQVTKDNK